MPWRLLRTMTHTDLLSGAWWCDCSSCGHNPRSRGHGRKAEIGVQRRLSAPVQGGPASVPVCVLLGDEG